MGRSQACEALICLVHGSRTKFSACVSTQNRIKYTPKREVKNSIVMGLVQKAGWNADYTVGTATHYFQVLCSVKCLTKDLAQVLFLLLLLLVIYQYKTLSLTLRDLAHKNLEETLVANQWIFPNHTLRTTGQTTMM